MKFLHILQLCTQWSTHFHCLIVVAIGHNHNKTTVIKYNVTDQLRDICRRNESCQVGHKNTNPEYIYNCCRQLSAEIGSMTKFEFSEIFNVF
jgi:hypothetical protein